MRLLHLINYEKQSYAIINMILECSCDENYFIVLNFNSNSNNYKKSNSKNVVYTEKDYLKKEYKKLLEADFVICHSLNFGPILIFQLFKNNRLRKNIVPIFWGADIYDWFKVRRSIKGKLNFFLVETLRKQMFSNICAFCTLARGDYNQFCKTYGDKIKNFFLFYKPDISLSELSSLKQKKQYEKKTKVLVGHQANPFNKHLEALKSLDKFKTNIEVYCPLSYGGNKNYVNSVIEQGEKIFGENFHPVLEMMPSNKYLEFLNDMDIIILPSLRQIGTLNIITSLLLKKKVYLSKDGMVFNHYKEMLDIEFYPYEDIPSLNFDDFVENKNKEKNYEKTKFFISNEGVYTYWKPLFDYLRSDIK